MNKEEKRIQEELCAGRSVIVATTGVSMEPLLHDRQKKNATHVLIVPHTGLCQVGDMPLVLVEDGRYILHRIIRIGEREGKLQYITRGDNCLSGEVVAPEQVLGIVQEIYYANKTLRVTDKRYRFYVWVWMRTFLFRRIHKKLVRFSTKMLEK